ncbi:hypothetical protein E2C01_052447 [Portunus trituberculatus]|uniref:Uncharacterized protein n=1 Tax=Portunus trituberculatus TaxID=210409 RepID=A0A5B7GHK4_PORTR|nr:hypothetical protein [Portunus trituberculatus]
MEHRRHSRPFTAVAALGKTMRNSCLVSSGPEFLTLVHSLHLQWVQIFTKVNAQLLKVRKGNDVRQFSYLT